MTARKALLISIASLIAGVSNADTHVPSGELTYLYWFKTHTGVLIKHTQQTDPEACGSGNYFILAKSHPHFEPAYAMLLSAFTAGREVSFTISGCLES